MRYFNPNSILAMILALCLLLVPGHTLAQEASQEPNAEQSNSEVLISLVPKGLPDGSRFEVEVEPGGTEELVAVMQNFGTEPVELRSFVTGIVPMPNGGLKIADRESERVGSTLWLGYESTEFVLQPGEIVERVITVTVPEDAQPGQYVNAVSVGTVNPINKSEGSQFNQYLRKVVSIYVVVPGEAVMGAEFGDPVVEVFRGQAVLQLPVKNTGNFRLDMIGTLTVTDLQGGVITETNMTLGPIYMGQETIIQTAILPAPPTGEYNLAYTFRDQLTDTVLYDEVVATNFPESTEIVAAPVTIANLAIEPNADPIVFADVTVDLNADTNFQSTRLTLSVSHNGTLVEDFVLAENLALPQGTTTVSQRYLPATNWESGTYTFSLKLESIEGGQSTVIFEELDVATLEVP